MKDITYKYSALCADKVSLIDGESYPFKDSVVQNAYGVYMLSGMVTITEGLAADIGKTRIAGDNLFAQVANSGDIRLQATGNTSWICLSRNDSGGREIQLQKVNGRFTLLSGWGFLVADGQFNVLGNLANQMDYFRPRDANVTVTGSGTLLLIR